MLNARKLAKKVLTKGEKGDILINVVARTAKQTERATGSELKSKPSDP